MQAEIYGLTGARVATNLINFLIDPIPANKRLDVAPNQEGGENQEDEEPGEQESQAHATEKEGEEVPTAALQTRAGRKACGDLPGRLRPRGSLAPGHAGCAWEGPAGAGCAGQRGRGAGAAREEPLLPNPPAQAVASKILSAWPVLPSALPLCFFFEGCEMATVPPAQDPEQCLQQEKLSAGFSSALVIARILPLGEPVGPQGHPRDVAGEDEEDDGAQHRARDPPGGRSSRAQP